MADLYLIISDKLILMSKILHIFKT